MLVNTLTFMAHCANIRDMKDCEIIFTNGQSNYQFYSADLQKALEWSKDKPVQCIKTPWGILQRWNEDEYLNAMTIFS